LPNPVLLKARRLVTVDKPVNSNVPVIPGLVLRLMLFMAGPSTGERTVATSKNEASLTIDVFCI
jgi:hypothetical protein